MARLLDRLVPANAPGLPQGLYLWSQRVCEQIEKQFDLIGGQIADIQAALDAAAAAQSAAGTAQTTANTVKRDDSITSSYTAPGTVLSASDAGSDATITIAGHTRIYGDISNKAVTGGSLTGLAYSTDYYVYYDQTSRAGGAVTYVSTTNPNVALPNKAAGRHFVGKVTTPTAGSPPTSGGSNPPSGGGTVGKIEVLGDL